MASGSGLPQDPAALQQVFSQVQRMFAESGFDATSIRQIVTEAGGRSALVLVSNAQARTVVLQRIDAVRSLGVVAVGPRVTQPE